MKKLKLQLIRCEKAESRLHSECGKMINELLMHFDECSFDQKELEEMSVMYQDSDGFVVVSNTVVRNHGDISSNCSVNMLIDHIDKYGMVTRDDYINCLI